MTELEFIGCAAEGQTKKLVAEADPKNGFFPDKVFNRLDGIGDRCRIARAVWKENPVGFERQYFFVSGWCRNYRYFASERFENSQDIEFNAKIHGDDVETGSGFFITAPWIPYIGLFAGDCFCQIAAHKPFPRASFIDQVVFVWRFGTGP